MNRSGPGSYMVNVWDEAPTAPWAQLRRRLSASPEVRSVLAVHLHEERSLVDHLEGIDFHRSERESDSTWFAARWHPGNVPVLIKLNVTAHELYWMATISDRADDIVAKVFASGEHLGDIDVRWLVLERLPHHPGREYPALLDAAVRFQREARQVKTDLVYAEDLGTMRALVAGHAAEAPGPARILTEHLEEDWVWLTSTIEREVCFGDLHFGNVASRAAPSRPELRLFDPIPRLQPWIFDAAYCEVITRGSGLVPLMATIRDSYGMSTGRPDVLDRAGTLFLGWMAIMWWGVVPGMRDREWHARAVRYIEDAAALRG
jgi:hypothetical protein